MAQDLHQLAEESRARQLANNYRRPTQVTHVNIDLGPVVMIVRAWNRFARRHLPEPVRVTLNTIFILTPVVLVISFVLSINGH